MTPRAAMIIESKLIWILDAGFVLTSILTYIGLGEMWASLTDMTAQEADQWSFKGFLILCVVSLFGIILTGVRYAMVKLSKVVTDNTDAMKANAAAVESLEQTLQVQNNYFNELGTKALLTALDKNGEATLKSAPRRVTPHERPGA